MTVPTISVPSAITGPSPWVIQRWTRASIAFASATVLLLAVLCLGPLWLQAGTVDRLTTLFIYVILAVMWNALAGYAGLVSIGHQAFFGLGAYAMVRLADAGLGPYPALLVGAVLVALAAVPLAAFMLRLQGGEFAIGMWVVAALAHLCVNLDSLVQGETGTSMIALQQYAADDRRAYTYWAALAAMVGLCWVVFLLLRSKVGTAAQAIRDNEGAAISLGVRVVAIKRLVFVLSAFGCALAGGLWLATSISFHVQWTAYMIFMVLVGGIGTMEGPILGALLFFAVETAWGGQGVLYLIGLGAIAMLFALFLPKGIWGAVQQRWDVHLLSAGYRVRSRAPHRGDAGQATAGAGASEGHP
ncbi:MAG: ABC transporter permease [Acidovorax sp. SCN 65-108]|nr:MAG: ABC transporter permease [Acidovorax sp. SCN 65-108]